jgi:hypothetical protein
MDDLIFFSNNPQILSYFHAFVEAWCKLSLDTRNERTISCINPETRKVELLIDAKYQDAKFEFSHHYPKEELDLIKKFFEGEQVYTFTVQYRGKRLLNKLMKDFGAYLTTHERQAADRVLVCHAEYGFFALQYWEIAKTQPEPRLGSQFLPLLIVLLIAVIALAYPSIVHQKKMLRSRAIAKGYVTYFGEYQRGNSNPGTFFFKVEGKTYEGIFSHSAPCRALNSAERQQILNTPIPVLYHPKDPTVNEILFFKKQYQHYNVQYPSKIAPILEAFFECSQ